jgi:hypothetical protein
MSANPTFEAPNLMVNLLVLIGSLVFFGISVLRFVKRWRQEPIRSRRPRLALGLAISFCAYVIWRGVTHAFQIPFINCGLSDFFEGILEYSHFFFLFARITMIFVDFTTANQSERVLLQARSHSRVRISVGGSGEQSPVSDVYIQRIFKLRKLITARGKNRAFFIIGGIVFIVSISALVVFVGEPKSLTVNKFNQICYQNQQEAATVEAIFSVIVSVLLVYTCFRLRKVKENFGISQELLILISFYSIKIYLLIINLFLIHAPEVALAQATNGVQLWMVFELWIPLLGITYFSLYHQSSRADKWRKMLQQAFPNTQVDDSNAADLAEFLGLIQSQRGYITFSQFLMLELDSEKLLFCRDVENYKKGQLSAREIYDSYISITADLHVDLSASVLDAIRKLFDQVDEKYLIVSGTLAFSIRKHIVPSFNASTGSSAPLLEDESINSKLTAEPSISPKAQNSLNDVFDDAQREVLMDIYTKSYGRFKLSPQYRKLQETNLIKLASNSAAQQFNKDEK